MFAWQVPDFVSKWVNYRDSWSTIDIYALARSTDAPIYNGRCSAFYAVLCGVLLVEASAWARRASQSRIMHADPRGSADLVLDVRLAGTGPSAHRVDGGPTGQRALLPM